jgi:hypothetical protein
MDQDVDKQAILKEGNAFPAIFTLSGEERPKVPKHCYLN